MPPYLTIYDGTTDPEDHIIHYVTAVKDNDLSKEQVPSVLLKKFGETLTGGALTWYSQLPARSIKTFEEMADKFVTAHGEAKKAEARVNDIFGIRQSPGDGLRDFLARFNRVRMGLPNVSKGMAVTAFQNGLNRNGSRATMKLLSRLMKYHPTTWEEINNTYCAEVRVYDDDLNGPNQRLTSMQIEPRKDRRNDSQRDQSGPRHNRDRHQPYVKNTIPRSPRHMEGSSRPHTGTQLNEREVVYALEKLGTKEWGHKTEDCIALRQEVVNMLNQGHLKELMSDRGRANFGRGREQHQGPSKPPSPARNIRTIICGGDEAAVNHIKFTTTHKLKRSITHDRYDDLEESIIFDKSATNDLIFPHSDALVITLPISDNDVKRIMVDDGSGA
ncbi:PREDICTED: uncharacterized protein LOC109235868 [Nicotiana attenuata]|uniref:uncharacterized protein LOC109235868 n=1 Tax=Nicotiana attenuata TaxID=49451 RepID=UPI0009054D5C|nr:PREDICTED: uncharacterized protein LOC109235868 [Nicotiana attenuata]